MRGFEGCSGLGYAVGCAGRHYREDNAGKLVGELLHFALLPPDGRREFSARLLSRNQPG